VVTATQVPEGSSPLSEELAPDPYPELDDCSPNRPFDVPNIHLNIIHHPHSSLSSDLFGLILKLTVKGA
jgi:hypothetical protein